MTNTTEFYEGATLTVHAGAVPVTGLLVHLSERRLELRLLHALPLFDLARPMYFSRFLLGDGFLGPEGEPFARQLLLDLHRAACYLEQELPRVAHALPARSRNALLDHLDPVITDDVLRSPTHFRNTVLRIEELFSPRGAAEWPLLHWQQPYLHGLTALQANVLLHRWLRRGPFDLHPQAGTAPPTDRAGDRSTPPNTP